MQADRGEAFFQPLPQVQRRRRHGPAFIGEVSQCLEIGSAGMVGAGHNLQGQWPQRQVSQVIGQGARLGRQNQVYVAALQQSH